MTTREQLEELKRTRVAGFITRFFPSFDKLSHAVKCKVIKNVFYGLDKDLAKSARQIRKGERLVEELGPQYK